LKNLRRQFELYCYKNRTKGISNLMLYISLGTAVVYLMSEMAGNYMLYNLLARLDSIFLPQIWKMEDVIEAEGTDYREYKQESKQLIAATVSTACSIKAVLDTSILTEDGELTEASKKITEKVDDIIYK